MKLKAEHRRRESGWLSKADVARCFDLSIPGLDRFVLRTCPEEHIRRDERGRIVAVYVAGLIQHLIGDGVAAGPGSPALERLREAKAALAEAQLDRQRGDLIDRAEAHTHFVEIATCLRHTGLTLAKRGGPIAAEIFEDGLRELEALVARHFAAPADSTTPAQESPLAHA
jgi:hypothetical protein